MTFTPGFSCTCCGANVKGIGEYHFKLKSEIWLLVADSTDLMCIGCIEKRLNRKLNYNDFTNESVNQRNFGKKSARLLNRLNKNLVRV